MRAFACFLFAVFLALPARAAERVPLADFFQNRTLLNAKLSPSGRHVAVLVNVSNGRDQLAVFGLEDKALKVVAGFRDDDIGRFDWVNDERLVYDTTDRQAAPGERRSAPGLYAVNRDGSKGRKLVDISLYGAQGGSSRSLPWNTFMLGQRASQSDDSVYVLQPDMIDTYNVRRFELLKLDTQTGGRTTVKGPEGNVMHWMLDAKGEPRLAMTSAGKRHTVHYLDPASGAWRALASFESFDSKSFHPLAFAPDGTLYVTTNMGGKSVLTTLDLATGKPAAQPLVRMEEYDFSGHLIASDDKLLGVRYVTDTSATAWFDQRMKEVQAKLDERLAGTVNLIEVPRRAQTPWLLVRAYSDRQPEVLYLYNADSGALTKVGDSQPRIRAEDMAAMDLQSFKARDGLRIPVWLTLPNGNQKNLPTVIMVHGGPYVHGPDWSWRPAAQFLASRGYAVVEPSFRGTTGLGSKHFTAGFKQWGLAMQDDIADAVKYAVDHGIADPKRVCIMGASYGGYATLMGLVRHPDLYKCGINWVGVTDLNLLYNGHWSASSDMGEAYKQYGFPVLIGDPVKDAEQFKATSPVQQASRITQPLLLAYGGMDRRVPIYHGRKFYDAVKSTNKDVEWIVYDDEGHGWSKPENRIDFWSRVEKFLQRHIGTP